jgi:hypothetical protein
VFEDDSSLMESDAETESGPVHTPGSFQADDILSMDEVCGKRNCVMFVVRGEGGGGGGGWF